MAVVSTQATLRMRDINFNSILSVPSSTISNFTNTLGQDGIVYLNSISITGITGNISQSLWIRGDIVSYDLNSILNSGMKVSSISQYDTISVEQTKRWSIDGLSYLSNTHDQLNSPPIVSNYSLALPNSIRTVSTVDELDLIESLLSGDDVITGSPGDDELLSFGGNDIISGEDGNDTIYGGDGLDTVRYVNSISSYRIGISGNGTIVSSLDGEQLLFDIETLEFEEVSYDIGDLRVGGAVEELMASREGTENSWKMPDTYVGPVGYLNNQMLGSEFSNVMGGTTRNDFFNLLEGDDAVDAGGGNDVLDGGTGSNFLTGGAGRDVFFLDGRGSAGGLLGQSTWSTITDWGVGEELSIWGWEIGVSTSSWAAFDGVGAWKGVTLHVDLDDDGTIDASVTWTGKTQSDLPASLEYAASSVTGSPGLLWFTTPTPS